MTCPSKLIVLLAGLFCAACQGPSPKPAAAPPVPSRAPPSLATDPCAIRMQDISAALLLYFTHHQDLPATLDALQPIATSDLKMDLAWTCPVDGAPYVYIPAGLAVPGQERLLVLYDANPVHNGWRWGIVAVLAEGTRPMAMTVVPLDQRVLDLYLQSAPAAK